METVIIEQRMNIARTEPKAYQHVKALSDYLKTTSVSRTHQELIKIRASQINHCVYCINMHTREARALGETEQRIYALSAWREAPYYTEEERAILALTEEVTLLSQHGVSDAVYQEAARLFDEPYLAQVIMSIVVINAWNRIAVSTRLRPD
ncbi:carboxymuconolactone decarboxylase family protein [Larkinella soli]|uniref:carboxymuconolactone decarboxylase family protein n=1 Tax=Larkinella soli TaxID=1770527 RepID=UPI0019D00945|nr:carboxymuconolactone decarboxylase family protein [Larkinella soli]